MATIDEIISKEALDRVVALTEATGKAAKNIDEIFKSSKNLNDQLSKPSKGGSGANAQKELNAQTQEAIRISKELEKTQAKLALVESEQNKKLIESQQQLAKKNAIQKESVKNNQLEAGSIAKLKAENAELKKQRDSINVSTDIGRKKVAELNAEMDKNTAIINQNSNSDEKRRANIGKYKEDISELVGKFKNGEIGLKGFANGIIGIGKSLFVAFVSNPVLLAITAIIGAFTLLYKAFTSTDSGATEMEARFEQLKAALSVLWQSVVKFVQGFIKQFSAWKKLFTGDFKGAVETFKEAAKDQMTAFDGIGEKMKNATGAAYDYIYALDAIEDAEDSYISRKSEIENQIARLQFDAQDRTKSTAERKKALEESLKLSEEEVKTQKEFAKRKYDAEIAYQAKTYGVSISQLDKFIKSYGAESDKLLSSDKKLAFARDKMGNDGQKKLEELYAAYIDADTKYFEENKRSMSKLSGFQDELNKERLEKQKKNEEEKKKLADNTAQYTIELEKMKIESMKDGAEKSIKLAEFEFKQKKQGYEKEVTNVKLRNELIAQAQSDLSAKILEINSKEIDDLLAAQEKQVDEDYQNRQKAAQNAIDLAKLTADEAMLSEVKLARDKYNASKKSEKDYESYQNELLQIKYNYDSASLKSTIDTLQKEIELLPDDNAKKIELKRKLFDAKKSLDDLEVQNNDSKNAKMIAADKEALEKRKQAMESIRDSSIGIANELLNVYKNTIDSNISDLESQKEYELKLAGDNEKAKEKIEEKYSQKIKIEKTKQARIDKAQSIFNITVSTATAAMKAYEQLGAYGTIAAALIAALGAAQIAVVATTPMPKFEKGTDFAPGGLSIVGEKGSELIEHKGMFALTPPTESVVDLPRGAKVYPHSETIDMLTNNDIQLSNILLANIEKAIKKSPKVVHTNDQYSIIASKNYREKRLNKYFN